MCRYDSPAPFRKESPTKGFHSGGCLLPTGACTPLQGLCATLSRRDQLLWPRKLNRRDRQGKAMRLGKFLIPAFPAGFRKVRDDGERKDSSWQGSACEQETVLCLLLH